MGDTFDFSKALKLLREGHHLTRSNGYRLWSSIFIDKSCQDRPIFMERVPGYGCRIWLSTQEDLLANDWMVADDDE